ISRYKHMLKDPHRKRLKKQEKRIMLFPLFRHGAARVKSVLALAFLALLPLGASASTTLTPGPIINISRTAENQFNTAVAIDPTNPLNVVSFYDASGQFFGTQSSISSDGG